MNVSAINNHTVTMRGNENLNNKKKFTDKFQEKLSNSADMSDCITVPRTIFKGYLGIMTGTSALTASSFVKNQTVKKSLGLAGVLTSLYGTWAFVRPYILKDKVPTVDLNTKK